jgi:hypothetical protein
MTSKDRLLTPVTPCFLPPSLFRRFFHERRGALPVLNYCQSEAGREQANRSIANLIGNRRPARQPGYEGRFKMC